MTAAEFLRAVGPRVEAPPMSQSEIEYLREQWSALLDELDYQDKKWYRFDWELRRWEELPYPELDDVLRELSVPESELELVKRQFYARNQETHRRDHEDVKRAQLDFEL